MGKGTDMALDEMTDLEDEALLALFAQGDDAAARALTVRLTPRAFAQAYRLTQNRAEAEDIAQEAMLRLWRIAPDWRTGEAQPATWLYRVVVNLCIDRARRKTPQTLEAATETADSAPAMEQQMQSRARAEALYTALDALPARQREAVVLRHIEGWSNPEIADYLGVGVEAVESLTARGKRALSTLLKGHKAALGFEDDT